MFAQKLGLNGIEIKHAHRVKRNSGDSNTNRPQTIVVLRTKQIYSKMTINSRHKIYLQTVISVRQNVEANYFLMTEFKRSLIGFDPNAFSMLHLNMKSIKSSLKI